MAKSSQPTSWRDALPIHPAAELFPRMTEFELRELGEDIKRRGLVSPIAIFKEAAPDGVRYSLLDGISRLDAMEMAGIKFEFGVSKLGERVIKSSELLSGTDVDVVRCRYICDDPFGYVASVNIHRRHLTTEQRRELAAKLLKSNPEKSNRRIAQTVGVSHMTVGTVRTQLESIGQIGQLTKTIGKDGKRRRRPASRPKPKSTAKDPAVVAAADRAGGEASRAAELFGPMQLPAASTTAPAAAPPAADPGPVKEAKVRTVAGTIDLIKTAFDGFDNMHRADLLLALRTLVREFDASLRALPTAAPPVSAPPTAPVDDLDIPGFLRRAKHRDQEVPS